MRMHEVQLPAGRAWDRVCFLRMRNSGCESGQRAQAAVWEACRILDRPLKETGCNLNVLFPAGIIDMGMGLRSGLL